VKLGVLISGGGTNLQAIIDACESGTIGAEVCVVISNREDAYGLERARDAGITDVFIDPKAYESADAYNHAIREVLDGEEADFVVMAGYMKLLGREILEAFPMRVLNIHPALLPSFPGAHGVAEALAWGVKVTGVTVHFASEVFDDGPIIAQDAVVVAENDSIETLEDKIHAVEHELYPAVISAVVDGRVRVEGRRVHVLPE
jgi:phosphoribosylglycinamide formyltransferase 1